MHELKRHEVCARVCSFLLRLVIWGLTDAVQLHRAALLTPFTLHTDVVVHLLRLLLCDAHTVSVIPVSAKVATNIKSAHTARVRTVIRFKRLIEQIKRRAGSNVRGNTTQSNCCNADEREVEVELSIIFESFIS